MKNALWKCTRRIINNIKVILKNKNENSEALKKKKKILGKHFTFFKTLLSSDGVKFNLCKISTMNHKIIKFRDFFYLFTLLLKEKKSSVCFLIMESSAYNNRTRWKEIIITLSFKSRNSRWLTMITGGRCHFTPLRNK